jgi:uncharacterized protein (DUF305 family)
MNSLRNHLLTPLATALVMAGCQSAGSHSAASSAPAPAAASTTHNEAVYVAKARADSARLPYTKADIDFMSGMIGHHAQAIKMASWAESHDASPAIRVLAARVTNAQRDEILTMQTWLRDRNQPVPEPNPAGMKMMMNGMEHVMLMPGMLTEQQMTQLDQAKGTDFDRLFLTFMIQHHKGAVSMVKDLFSTYGAGQDETVFKFANDVQVDQSTEIARMEKMLLFTGAPVPPGDR